MSLRIQRILVPVDGEELTGRAITASIDLAQQLGAALVGYVAEPLAPLPTMALPKTMVDQGIATHDEQAAAHAQPVLSRFAEQARAAGVPFEGVFEQVPSVDKAIVAAAQAQRCDLIVMVTHGRSVLGELLLGSHTKSVLAQSTLPLLVLR